MGATDSNSDLLRARLNELEAQRDEYLNREWIAEKARLESQRQLAQACKRLAEVEDECRQWEIDYNNLSIEAYQRLGHIQQLESRMKQFDERDIWDVPQLSFTEWLYRTTGARWPFLLALVMTGCVWGGAL